MPLIVLEGVDASGKATQSEKLYLRLLYDGERVRKVSFPNYGSEASAPVRMYLSGSFGHTAEEVNPYAASTFYAVDRYASYMQYWKDFLKSGGIVIADRYVTSNFIHQAQKIHDDAEREAYLSWQEDFEYNKLGLPRPDMVLFLDVPPDVSIELMKTRANKITGRQQKDIHESDPEYIRHSYENAVRIAGRCGFTTIDCADGGRLLDIDTISDKIYEKVRQMI